jgi:nicotinamide-nucleotide amidase
MTRSDVIICSGGLGPTVDDVTRQAIANATGRLLFLHDDALATLKARFARFGVQMTENNVQQAYIPEGAILIPNPVGTAPGFIVETERCAIIALPGVPREMKHLMNETVLPYLRSRAGNVGVIRRRVLRTIGVGESMIDAMLGELMHGANPTIGLAAHTAQVDVRITARASTPDSVEAMLDDFEAEVRSRIGQYVYSTTPGEGYESVVVRGLLLASATVALLETSTRGALAQRMATAVPDFNPVVARWVADVDPLPAALAQKFEPSPAPIYSETLAAECAELLRQQTQATYGIVLLGTSGENEGVYGQQSGETWIALAGPEQVLPMRCPFGGQDEYTIVRIGNQALGMLKRILTS